MSMFGDLLALAQAAPPTGTETLLRMLPYLAVGVLFYVMLVQPERRKQRALTDMVKNLKKNDRVVTSGGLLGTVVSVNRDSDEILMRIDENNNTRVHVLRSAIVRVNASDSAEESKAAP